MNNIQALVRKYYPLITQLFRFGIVGLTAAAINFSTVIYLVQIWQLTPLVANVFGFLVAFQMSYWGHRLWTFNGTTALHRVALPKLIFISALNFGINESLFYILLSMNLPYPIALLIVQTVLPVFTFLSNKLWVFR